MTTPDTRPLTREEVMRWGPERGYDSYLRDIVLTLLDRTEKAEAERDDCITLNGIQAAQLVALTTERDELKRALDAETDHRMTAVESTRRAEAQCAVLRRALDASRRIMHNDWHNKPRIGMEAECAAADAALRDTVAGTELLAALRQAKEHLLHLVEWSRLEPDDHYRARDIAKALERWCP